MIVMKRSLNNAKKATMTRTITMVKFMKILQQPAIETTKHGKSIAKLVPFSEERKSLFGTMAGSVQIISDITEPTDEKWEAE